MKLFSRILWLCIIILLISELLIFRQDILYHLHGTTPKLLTAGSQTTLENQYVTLDAALDADRSLVIETPGYELQIFQHPSVPNLYFYDLGNNLKADHQAFSSKTTFSGRLLPLTAAPYSRETSNHFAVSNPAEASVLLLNVAPRKSTFTLYLAAILFTILLVAVTPFIRRFNPGIP